MPSSLFLVLGALLSFCSATDPRYQSQYAPTPGSVKFVGDQLTVDGQPFFIQGLCYSPVPVGESPVHEPFGDYFSAEYAYIWKRDLPLIKAMGVNSIRIYGWDTTHNVSHVDFLDEVHRNGLKIFLTFYVGTKFEKPPVYINSTASKEIIYANFTREVGYYNDHPAILMWTFGNELNGPWLGFFDQINQQFQCGWSAGSSCWNADTLSADCLAKNECLYKNFFQWIDMAAVRAKDGTSRPVVSGLADIDRIVDSNKKQNVSKIQLYGHYAPNIAAWGFQLYRGITFGSYFKYFKRNVGTSKPLIITEYGTDAYNDPCGWPQNLNSPLVCQNIVGKEAINGGGVSRYADGTFIGCKDIESLDCDLPGEEAQAKWNVLLANELWANRVSGGGSGPLAPTVPPTCTGPFEGECKAKIEWMTQNWRNDPRYAEEGVDGSPCSIQQYFYSGPEGQYCPDPYNGVGQTGENIVAGGFLMAWMDEFWKGNVHTQAGCAVPCNTSNFSSCDPAQYKNPNRGIGECSWKAHWECTHDTYYHGLCGYRLEGAPDFYINEEWFGHTMPVACGHFVPNPEPNKNPQKYGLDTITVRPAMKNMQQMWAPAEFAKGQPFVPLTCEEMLPCWQCIQDNPPADGVVPAFRGTCKVQCDMKGSPPTIAPLVPTPAVPTAAVPTSAAVPTPAVVAPTPAISGPTPAKPGPTPAGPVPTPMDKELKVTIELNKTMTGDRDTWEKELKVDLAALTEVDVKADRFHVLGQNVIGAGPQVLVDFNIVPGNPPASHLYDLINEAVTELMNDPDYGCTGASCKVEEREIKALKILKNVVPSFGVSLNGGVAPSPAAPAGDNTITIIIVVVAVIVVLALLFGLRRYLHAQKLARSRLLSYHEGEEGDYVAPEANNSSNVNY